MRLRRADFPHWTQATEMRGPRSFGDRAMRRSCCTKIELRDRMWLCCVQHPSLVNAHETFRASGRAEGSRAFANSPADLPEISVANEAKFATTPITALFHAGLLVQDLRRSHGSRCSSSDHQVLSPVGTFHH